MDRKDFFRSLTSKKQASRYGNGRMFFSGLNPYSGNWTINEVTHLLKRAMFGAKKTDIDYFLSTGMDAAVDELLNNIVAPSPPLRDYGLIEDDNGGMHDDLGVPQGQTWVNDPNTASDEVVRGSIDRLRFESLRKWWSGLILNQDRSIQEKMVLFWHHHYAVQQEEVGNSLFLWRHHNLLRSNVLGNVKDLAKEVTIDPAMLLHLNGYLNSRQAADENYAREFQELFTIGRESATGFTENDVIACARVLTGWRFTTNPITVYSDTSAHDTTSKTFSSFYNNTVISGGDAMQELNALVDMIFATNEAAKFFCRKIYKWFVYYEIDEDTELNVIAPLADILRNNNYNVQPMLVALFKSEHFFDTINQSCYIKTPFDILAGTMREFNVPVPAYTDYATGYPMFQILFERASMMQMELFQPPDVSGYAAYTQDPMNYELWVNSNSLPRRADYTDSLVNESIIDVRAFAGYSSNPADPDQLVSDVTTLLLRYPLSVNSKNYVKQNFLLNNTTDNTIWTNAWNTNDNSVIDSSLKNMFRFIMNLPEFHLC